ncbi:hypothetical protein AKJ16_DCAP01994 [Drosera capensis]
MTPVECRTVSNIKGGHRKAEELKTVSFLSPEKTRGVVFSSISTPSIRRRRSKLKSLTHKHVTMLQNYGSPVSYMQTTSRRLADRKIQKFEKNVTKRGIVPESTAKNGSDYPVGPIVLGFFVFVLFFRSSGQQPVEEQLNFTVILCLKLLRDGITDT